MSLSLIYFMPGLSKVKPVAGAALIVIAVPTVVFSWSMSSVAAETTVGLSAFAALLVGVLLLRRRPSDVRKCAGLDAASAAKLNPRRRRLFKCLSLSIGCVTALVVLEAGLRIFQPFRFRVSGDQIELPANQLYRFTNERLPGLDATVIQRRNSLGLRGPDPPADFQRALTVIAVGGSTTECAFLSDGDDWPAVALDRLKSKFPDIWINNAGLDGHSTYGHRILLKDHLLAIAPKVMLFLLGINEVGRKDLRDSETNKPAHRTLLMRLANVSATVNLLVNFCRNRAAVNREVAHSELRLAEQPLCDPADDDVEALLADHRVRFIPAYEARLRGLIADCFNHDIVPVLITQSALYGHGTDDVSRVDLGRVASQRGLSGASAWALLEAYNDVTRNLGEELDIPVIDLAAEMPKSSRFYYDFTHYNIEGGKWVGEFVASKLAPILSNRFAGE